MQYNIYGYSVGFNYGGELKSIPLLKYTNDDKISVSLSLDISNAVLFLASRKIFPEMDEDGNYDISPSVKIKSFVIGATDAFAANAAIIIINKRMENSKV